MSYLRGGFTFLLFLVCDFGAARLFVRLTAARFLLAASGLALAAARLGLGGHLSPLLSLRFRCLRRQFGEFTTALRPVALLCLLLDRLLLREQSVG